LSFSSYIWFDATTRFSNSYTKFNNGGFPHVNLSSLDWTPWKFCNFIFKPWICNASF
jgi:hypothetical protein